jgi:hypothetical protein
LPQVAQDHTGAGVPGNTGPRPEECHIPGEEVQSLLAAAVVSGSYKCVLSLRFIYDHHAIQDTDEKLIR